MFPEHVNPKLVAGFELEKMCWSSTRNLFVNITRHYAMTVFFCEQDGGDWLENDMWLSDLHECD
jgi:hypothetical protein